MAYRIDPRRVTYRELRSEASPFTAGLAWLILRLGVPIPGSSDHPTVDDLEPHRIHSSSVPADVAAELSESKEQLEALGFKGTIYHRFLDTRSQTEIFYASYLHKSGKVIARVTRRVFMANTPPKKVTHCAFITPLSHGRTLATVNCKGDLEGPASCLDEGINKATIAETWKRHRERMADPMVRESIGAIGDGRELLAVLQKRHKAITDHFVDRRLFVPVDDPTPKEDPFKPAASSAADEAAPAVASSSDELLLAEVRKLEDKQPTSWGTSLIVLVGTIALFLALGGAVWSWRFTMLLIPILLLHEAGHFLAMKLFDYRNVQMFFIPLFGAAVTGRHYDVPGWKRVVTSLMGPVPGILIGSGLGIAALWHDQDLLLEAATLAVVVNGFNLIPALPLDGGWVLHGLLFSRHAFLDLLSRMLAIGFLFFFAFVGGAKIMMFVGISMIIGLPMSFHLARITDRLRGAKPPLGGPVGGHVPPQAVARIGAEIDKAYPKGIDIRNKSRLALQVYENVNSRPPGWLATLTLGAVYVGSFLLAFVAGIFFTVAQNADLQQLIDDAVFGPQAPVSSSDIEVRGAGGADPATVAWGELMVANYESAEAASSVYNGLAPGLDAMRFGASIVVPLGDEMSDDDRDALFDQCEASTDDLFVSEEGHVMGAFAAMAPDIETAQRISDAVAGQTSIPAELRPIPPWAIDAQLTDAQQLARATVRRLLAKEWFEGVEVNEEVYEQIGSAIRRGRERAAEQVRGRIVSKYESARADFLQELRMAPAGEVDLAVLDAYEAGLKQLKEAPPEAAEEQAEETFDDEGLASALYDFYPAEPEPKDWIAPVADRLGCDPPDAEPRPASSMSFGYGEANGLMVNTTATFRAAPAGPVAMLRWLESLGCTGIKYSLSQSWL